MFFQFFQELYGSYKHCQAVLGQTAAYIIFFFRNGKYSQAEPVIIKASK